MKKKINIFLPCRKGSQRVLKKNTRTVGKFRRGLFEIKIKQLLKIKYLNKIYISTNDEKIIKYSKNINSSKLVIHKRKEKLSNSNTSTDELVEHALELIQNDHILWTHVTSPFITTDIYNKIISVYFEKLRKGYDSLMTVNKIQNFLWSHEKPINYNRKIEKWPRTQTIKPLFEVNSGVFLSNSKIYKKNKDRIGKKVFLYELSQLDGFDIDWKEDFVFFEKYLVKKLSYL